MISFTDRVNLGTYCENLRTNCVRFCANDEINSKMWKTRAFHRFNPFSNLLRHQLLFCLFDWWLLHKGCPLCPWRLQNGRILGKVPRGGGGGGRKVTFNPKNNVADFGPSNRAFWAWNWKQRIATWFSENEGGAKAVWNFSENLSVLVQWPVPYLREIITSRHTWFPAGLTSHWMEMNIYHCCKFIFRRKIQ